MAQVPGPGRAGDPGPAGSARIRVRPLRRAARTHHALLRLDEGPAEAVHLAVGAAGVTVGSGRCRRAARAASGWSRSSRTRGSRAGPPAGLRDERPVRSRPREPHNPHPGPPGPAPRPSPPGLSARRPGPEPALDVTATDLLTDYLSNTSAPLGAPVQSPAKVRWQTKRPGPDHPPPSPQGPRSWDEPEVGWSKCGPPDLSFPAVPKLFKTEIPS